MLCDMLYDRWDFSPIAEPSNPLFTPLPTGKGYRNRNTNAYRLSEILLFVF